MWTIASRLCLCTFIFLAHPLGNTFAASETHQQKVKRLVSSINKNIGYKYQRIRPYKQGGGTITKVLFFNKKGSLVKYLERNGEGCGFFLHVEYFSQGKIFYVQEDSGEAGRSQRLKITFSNNSIRTARHSLHHVTAPEVTNGPLTRREFIKSMSLDKLTYHKTAAALLRKFGGIGMRVIQSSNWLVKQQCVGTIRASQTPVYAQRNLSSKVDSLSQNMTVRIVAMKSVKLTKTLTQKLQSSALKQVWKAAKRALSRHKKYRVWIQMGDFVLKQYLKGKKRSVALYQIQYKKAGQLQKGWVLADLFKKPLVCKKQSPTSQKTSWDRIDSELKPLRISR